MKVNTTLGIYTDETFSPVLHETQKQTATLSLWYRSLGVFYTRNGSEWVDILGEGNSFVRVVVQDNYERV